MPRVDAAWHICERARHCNRVCHISTSPQARRLRYHPDAWPLSAGLKSLELMVQQPHDLDQVQGLQTILLQEGSPLFLLRGILRKGVAQARGDRFGDGQPSPGERG